MLRHHRLYLALAMLVLFSLALPLVPSVVAQSTDSQRVLCYLPPGSNNPQDCSNLSSAEPQPDPPWDVRTVTGAEINRIQDLSIYAMIVIGRSSATSLNDQITRLKQYVEDGGKLLLLDPDLGALLDPSLAAPTASPDLSQAAPVPSEFTRAGRFTPTLSELSAEQLPRASFSLVPIATLGEAWIAQTRSGFGNASHTTIASALLGEGRVVLAPGGLNNNLLASALGSWTICCIVFNGPNMSLNAIEVTQAIQDLNNSVDLVAGKRTFVRVHVSSPEVRSGLTATLSGKRNGVALAPVLTPINPGGTITVKPSPNRGQINDSFLFELPASWTNTPGNLELRARLDPGNTVFDPVTSNNRQTLNVTLLNGPTMRLRIYNVRYTVGGTTYLANTSHLDALESWLRRAYPIANLSVARRTYNYPDPGLPNVDTLNSRMGLAWLFEVIFGSLSSRTLFYGMVDDGGGFMRGKALGIPSIVSSGPTGTPGGSWGWDTDGSYGDWYGGHEIAHTLGRYHAEFCGAGGGTAFPYPNGQISPVLSGNTAIYGFDIGNRTVYPPSWRDVMTYCNNQWVSDFTYEGIRQRFAALGGALAEPELQQGTYLLVNGRVELANGSGRLGTINVLTGSGTTTPISGTWSIVLLDGANVLNSYPFTPAEMDDDEDPSRPALFAEMVPWNGAATRIQLRNGDTVVDERAVSANAPTVTVSAPTGGDLGSAPVTVSWAGNDADGDSLRYSLLYSNDNGVTWRALISDMEASEATIDPTGLPGGSNCYFRVVASDGVLSGQGDSALVSVPDKAPLLTIDGPAEGATFFPAQPVALAAASYDLEDSERPADALNLAQAGPAVAWSSDRDGDLGTGTLTVTAGLSTGTHILTLTATDSAANTTIVTRTITVAEGTAVLTAQLDLAPQVIGEQVILGTGVQTTTLSTRLVGDDTTPITWTAQSNAAWVQLQSGSAAVGATASGSTPDNLTVLVDPRGLGIGSYNTTISITGGGQTIDIPVNLNIDGQRTFVPLIAR